VAYLGHARIVTSKHAPAITQQYTKRCFLRSDPSRAEPWTSPSSRRIASSRLLPGNSYKHLDDARVGKGHVTASAVTSRVRSDATIKAFFRKSDQGFIGVRSRSDQLVLESSREFSVADSRGRSVAKIKNWRVIRRTDSCVIFGVWNCYSCVLRAVASKRLMKSGES
jgi:hypothetical protein